MSDPTETSVTVEVVYRGIFQKTLAQRICRSIVLAARKRGHTGTAFARYGDSPERNGVPAKQFAVVAINDLELEASMAKYEPAVVDVSIAVDDTLVKGVESWAWYGRQPIWKPVKRDGFVLVTSDNTPGDVLAQTDKAERPYTLVIVPGGASFAGLWVFKDDHTDYRVLGALAKIAPDWVRLDDVMALIREQTRDESAAQSAQYGYDAAKIERPREAAVLQARMDDDASRHRGRRTQAGRAEPAIQEIHGADAAPSRELRHVHQVHDVLARLSRRVLRGHARGPLRGRVPGVHRLRHLRAGVPGEGLHRDGRRAPIRRQRRQVAVLEEGPRRVQQVVRGKERRLGEPPSKNPSRSPGRLGQREPIREPDIGLRR